MPPPAALRGVLRHPRARGAIDVARGRAAPVLRPYALSSRRWPGQDLVLRRVVVPGLAVRPIVFTRETSGGFSISGSTDELIERTIYLFGVWEPDLTEYLVGALGDGDVMVDVGAHIGYFSLLASRRVGPGGQVIAFEASPTTAAETARQLARNRATNVTLHNLAVTDRPGTVLVEPGRPGNRGMATVRTRPAGTEASEAVEVAAGSLATLLPPDLLPRIRVVKIDVEGAEADVLTGLFEALPAMGAVEIAVEVSPGRLGSRGQDLGGLLADLADLGFHAYALRNSYDPRSYRNRRPLAALPRVRTVPTEQVDLVFSRVDAEELPIDRARGGGG